jgi:murein DD-endopeptidase MepM/ murein hydrolase activator NlpD
MAFLRGLLLISAAGALAACASKSSAPVVYGSNPEWQGQIYNAPSEVPTAARDARRTMAAQPRTYAAPTAPVEMRSYGAPTQLAGAGELKPIPASMSASENNVRRQRFNYDAEPVYLSAEARDRARAQQVSMKAPAATGAGMVTVRAGDTVYAIARRTGASPNDIITMNRLRAPYTLSVGQSLRVPSGGEATTLRQNASVTSKPSTRTHLVRSGDTLYSIARSNGLSIQELARANGLRQPYTLSVGQSLKVPGGNAITVREKAPQREASVSATPSEIARVSYTKPEVKAEPSMFDWPLKGAILNKYSNGQRGKRNDGINIAAPIGTPVRAAADGEVVYRGGDLEGYGNLLLVKHDGGFVTAYAHNDVMLVKKGDRIRQGQVIAKVGQTGSATEPQLHFEIRENLKAVDPLAFLGS